MTPFPIYVGYDIREHLAWLVCKDTLMRPVRWYEGRPDRPIQVIPLAHRELRRQKLFWRSWRTEHDGQFSDEGDNRPFSTEFSHSRFLTPLLALEARAHLPQGQKGWAMFVDCDFMFRRPVTNLLAGLDPSKACYVVKHDFANMAEGVKMDGMIQQRYFRKLWSSLILFNLDHPKVQQVNWLYATNHLAGRELHDLHWFSDHEIGDLGESWNWIPGHSDDMIEPNAVHWSLGGPWLADYRKAAYAAEWDERLNDIVGRMVEPDNRHGYFEDLMPIL